MTLIDSLVLCFFFMASSCHQETPNDAEFSINVRTDIEVEFGRCIQIPFSFTYPINKVKFPYKVGLFREDPENIIKRKFYHRDKVTENMFKIKGLPHGTYEYGFKLEWQSNQYVFPERVRISISAPTQKPTVMDLTMKEGETAWLQCDAPRLCINRTKMYFKWTESNGSVTVYENNGDDKIILYIAAEADDHNTSVTCVVEYNDTIIEKTVTLTVKSAPKILNGSHCIVEGELLHCVCISQGNPLPPITWPLASLTDFSVTSTSSIQTVHSIITMPTADHYSPITCISTNDLGQAVMDIPLQNHTKIEYGLTSNPMRDAVHPWIITGVSLSMNLVLLAILIISTHNWGKGQEKECGEDMDTYASLNLAAVEQPYGVITPQTR
ncbi:neuronal growth regulator 1 [Larimichthys crocea]|uniref:neuronal growth regulator 1 n=1 Tax=Larimichthys crocea TaxID=215358 RepID=UPI000F5DEAD3|nr:neuronal growth regulator 1 [Larimichthys crocea]